MEFCLACSFKDLLGGPNGVPLFQGNVPAQESVLQVQGLVPLPHILDSSADTWVTLRCVEC